MVTKDEERNEDAVWEPIPYLGRSVRVVGDWRSVDASQTPHEKNKRGELGKPLHNWYFNRTSRDPLGRIATANTSADRRNAIESHIAGAPRGRINPVRTEVADPRVMAEHIKRVAKHLGASDVGIMRVHPSFLYSARPGGITAYHCLPAHGCSARPRPSLAYH